MTRRKPPATTFGAAVETLLAPVDTELARRYPGDPGTRQPVHTVYVSARDLTADTPRTWGAAALGVLAEHAPDAASFGAVTGLSGARAEAVYDRVRTKLAREPVEDLRIDFEDGYDGRTDAEEDGHAARAARLVAEAYRRGTAAPYTGIRMKSLESAVRSRAIRTLDVFLTGLVEHGGLPGGLVLTLPKVSRAEQVTAMAGLLTAFERAHGPD